MNELEPSIRVNVDLTNPGQFFACCGLLELADRLWPGAEGWFTGRSFCIACAGRIQPLLSQLADSEINSSLTNEGIKRLGSLLSAEKSSLTPEAAAEKERLRLLWNWETLLLCQPFGLRLDWWRDERGERTELKTWAAKQFALEIARPLLRSLRATCSDGPFQDILARTAIGAGLPFYFDAHASSQNTPRDTGFGLYTLRNDIKTSGTKPLLEILAFFGIQRFRPSVIGRERICRFNAWPNPMPPSIAAVAAARMFRLPGERSFEFRLLNRSQYMKAFLPARPLHGD